MPEIRYSKENNVRIYLSGLFLLIAAIAACASLPARADDFIVYSPYVVQGQTEFEFRGYSLHDNNPNVDGKRAYKFAVGHAFTDWWRPEIYFGRYQREPGGTNAFQGYEFENFFQLAPQGEYWADPGLLVSYEYNTQSAQPNALEFGPLFEKRAGRYVHRLNLIWEKEIGRGASGTYEFQGRYGLSWQWRRAFAPGLEFYAQPHDHAYRLGPVLSGELVNARGGNEFEYSAGLLAGINRRAPDLTFVLRLEYEFF